MKKTFATFLAFILLTSAVWASAINYLDTYRPLPYDINPVDKTLISYQTAKNFSGTTSEFFKGNFLYAYLPYGQFDLRIETLFFNNAGPYLRLGSLIKTDVASYHVAFESVAPDAKRMMHLEAFWDNGNFIWGVGLSHDIENSLAYWSIKIGKLFRLDGYDIDTKASINDCKTSSYEYDITARIFSRSMPGYIGLTLVNPPGGDLQKIVDIGVLFNI